MAGEEPFADPSAGAPEREVQLDPSEADVVGALADIERATAQQQTPIVPPATPSRFQRHKLLYSFVIVYMIVGAGIWLSTGWQSSKRQGTKPFGSQSPPSDPATQQKAESLLQRAINGDNSAADEILAQSADWIGKTRRTPSSDGLVTSGLNSPNMHVREATIQAAMALDGVPANESGFDIVLGAVGNPQRRAWALWTLGGLGNRGVERDRVAKILGDYLQDTSPNIRAAAVDGMSLLATDEVLPLMLDRFRNDPSPLVQERAACGLAQSGMFTQQQRMIAAASIVGWTDDQLLSAQQRNWAFQALRDISGQNFGTDSAAWRNWLTPVP